MNFKKMFINFRKKGYSGIIFFVYTAGIVVDFGKRSTEKKRPPNEKKYIFSKKSTHFTKKKALLEQKKSTQ